MSAIEFLEPASGGGGGAPSGPAGGDLGGAYPNPTILARAAVGSVLSSGGVGAPPVWSANPLVTTVTAGQVSAQSGQNLQLGGLAGSNSVHLDIGSGGGNLGFAQSQASGMYFGLAGDNSVRDFYGIVRLQGGAAAGSTGHLVSQSTTAPTLSLPATNVTATLIGACTDVSGIIQLVVATTAIPAGTDLVTLTFVNAWGAQPRIFLTPVIDATANVSTIPGGVNQTAAPLASFALRTTISQTLPIGTNRYAYFVIGSS